MTTIRIKIMSRILPHNLNPNRNLDPNPFLFSFPLLHHHQPVKIDKALLG